MLVLPGLAVLSAVYLTNQQSPLYRAAAEVAVLPSPEVSEPADVMRGLETLERRTIIATFASIAETREALDSTALRLGLEQSEVSGYRIQASVVPRTNIIRITAEGRDGERVSLLANGLVGVVADQARAMYRIFDMRPVEAARPALRPFHPDPSRNAVIAAILGLFSGLLLALVLEYLRSGPSHGERSSPETEASEPTSGDGSKAVGTTLGS
jgi:capsular polysaccharide biosynthesis protein